MSAIIGNRLKSNILYLLQHTMAPTISTYIKCFKLVKVVSWNINVLHSSPVPLISIVFLLPFIIFYYKRCFELNTLSTLATTVRVPNRPNVNHIILHYYTPSMFPPTRQFGRTPVHSVSKYSQIRFSASFVCVVFCC